MKASPVKRSPKMMSNGQASSDQSNYYIFNSSADKGYVIVSGDDRTTPILGYIDQGSFDPNNVPTTCLKIKTSGKRLN